METKINQHSHSSDQAAPSAPAAPSASAAQSDHLLMLLQHKHKHLYQRSTSAPTQQGTNTGGVVQEETSQAPYS